MTLTNSIVLSTVPPERAGAASAVSETGIELGGALGVAVLGSVLSSAYRVGLDPVEGVSSEVMGSARETFANALRQAAETGGAAGRSLAGAARDAFAGGVQLTGIVGAGLLVVATAQAWVLLRPGGAVDDGADRGDGADPDGGAASDAGADAGTGRPLGSTVL